jgi:hypothetical protein
MARLPIRHVGRARLSVLHQDMSGSPELFARRKRQPSVSTAVLTSFHLARRVRGAETIIDFNRGLP